MQRHLGWGNVRHNLQPPGLFFASLSMAGHLTLSKDRTTLWVAVRTRADLVARSLGFEFKEGTVYRTGPIRVIQLPKISTRVFGNPAAREEATKAENEAVLSRPLDAIKNAFAASVGSLCDKDLQWVLRVAEIGDYLQEVGGSASDWMGIDRDTGTLTLHSALHRGWSSPPSHVERSRSPPRRTPPWWGCVCLRMGMGMRVSFCGGAMLAPAERRRRRSRQQQEARAAWRTAAGGPRRTPRLDGETHRMAIPPPCIELIAPAHHAERHRDGQQHQRDRWPGRETHEGGRGTCVFPRISAARTRHGFLCLACALRALHGAEYGSCIDRSQNHAGDPFGSAKIRPRPARAPGGGGAGGGGAGGGGAGGGGAGGIGIGGAGAGAGGRERDRAGGRGRQLDRTGGAGHDRLWHRHRHQRGQSREQHVRGKMR